MQTITLQKNKEYSGVNTQFKKCLVLDLDNTLWGGVAEEEGPGGIALGLEGLGGNFLAFQQRIKDLYDQGIILAINSKNNEKSVLEIIENHPNMILREKHFAALRINWRDKADNMREIAQELNIGLDAIVFLDDEPYNRALVASKLPEVTVPDMPKDPEEYVRFLSSLPYFRSEAVTNEDTMRGNLYVTERLRKAAQEKSASPEAFLKNLKMEVRGYTDATDSLSRLAQLSGKTNQFNMCKVPLSEAQIKAYAEDENSRVFHMSAEDKFGSYGIIALAVAQKKASDTWSIKSWLMSCRALGRGIEESFFPLYAR